MVGTKDAAGKSDLYYEAAAISGCWEIMILMEFMGGYVGRLELANCLAHFKVPFSRFLSAKSLRTDHHLPLNNFRQRLVKNLIPPSFFSNLHN
jgi:hypothetical protein